ncbi:hypothetical protein NDU88_007821, partial [Pleurodeles waltl]
VKICEKIKEAGFGDLQEPFWKADLYLVLVCFPLHLGPPLKKGIILRCSWTHRIDLWMRNVSQRCQVTRARNCIFLCIMVFPYMKQDVCESLDHSEPQIILLNPGTPAVA